MNISLLKRIWYYVRKYKIRLIMVLLYAILGNTIVLIGPLLIGKSIDLMAGVNQVDFGEIMKLCIFLFLLYLLSSLFQWMMSLGCNIVANRTIKDIRKDIFHKINRLPLSNLDIRPHGDIISRMTNDIDAMSEGLFQGITQLISGIVIIIGTFAFMLTISPLITVIVVCITPICFFIASFISKKSHVMFREQSKMIGEINGYVEEIIGSQKVVKAFGYEKRAEKRFTEMNAELYVWGQKAQWYSSLTNPTTRLVNNAAYVVVTVLGGFLAIGGALSIGNIASFITYSNQFAKPINEITSITTQIQSAFASARRVFSLLDETEESLNPYREIKTDQNKELDGKVEFRHVNFSYLPKEPLITDLNLDVKSGDMVAIVGPTGAGKSTLVNLLMRFYDVKDGEILIDGKNINGFSKDTLRQSFGMVLQESWLFHGTIADNISFGKPDATREEIIAAAKEAHAHDFIKRLGKGYDTIIEEDGRNISGGQKQLLSIARVLLMNPPMLILDEATSSIDTRTEVLIQKAFQKMMKGKTSFVIAHRLSTIREADTILVMRYGEIVEQGTHEELIEKEGFYYQLYNSQFEKE